MFQRTTAILLLLVGALVPYAAPGIAPIIHFKPGQNIYVSDATADAQGHVYLCGVVKRGTSLPGRVVVRGNNGTNEFDVFVMKLRANGSPLTTLVLYANDLDFAERITTDSQGNVVIYG